MFNLKGLREVKCEMVNRQEQREYGLVGSTTKASGRESHTGWKYFQSLVNECKITLNFKQYKLWYLKNQKPEIVLILGTFRHLKCKMIIHKIPLIKFVA